MYHIKFNLIKNNEISIKHYKNIFVINDNLYRTKNCSKNKLIKSKYKW